MASDLPFGSEFSPSQIDLPELLEIIARHEGDPSNLEREILTTYFSGHGAASGQMGGKNNRKKLANNCKLGLVAYGLAGC